MKIGQATIDEALETYLLREGFRFSPERDCYFMETEKFRHWNNKPWSSRPMTGGVEDLPRLNIFGDTGKPFDQILNPKS